MSMNMNETIESILLEEVSNFDTGVDDIYNLYSLIEYVNKFNYHSYNVWKSSYNDELIIRIYVYENEYSKAKLLKYRTKSFINDGDEKYISYKDNIEYIMLIFEKNVRINKINYLLD